MHQKLELEKKGICPNTVVVLLLGRLIDLCPGLPLLEQWEIVSATRDIPQG